MTGEAATMGIMERLGTAATTWRKRLDGVTPVQVPDAHRETPEDRAERLRLQAQNRARRWTTRLPVMYATASLASLSPDQHPDTIRGWLDTPSSTLLLAGNVGTGKTHAAYAVGHAAVARGLWTEAWTLSDLLETLRAQDGTREAALDAVRHCHVLILDDLTTVKVSDWAQETLTSLLDHRLRNERRQVVTTNSSHAQVLEGWGPRAMDRLAFRWTVVPMVGESRRVAAW